VFYHFCGISISLLCVLCEKILLLIHNIAARVRKGFVSHSSLNIQSIFLTLKEESFSKETATDVISHPPPHFHSHKAKERERDLR
jgi:hypothetical protein